MNREECIQLLYAISDESLFYESDRGTRQSYEMACDRNKAVIEYIKENLK